MIEKLFVFGLLLSSTAGLKCYLSDFQELPVSFTIDGSTGSGIVGGRGSNQNENVVNNIKKQLNYNGELTNCDTPPETTLCVKQNSSVDKQVLRSGCITIINKTKYFRLRLDEVSSERPKRDLRDT